MTQHQASAHTLLLVAACLGLIFASILPTDVRAQNIAANEQANYAFAIFTGTGRYSLDDRTIYVFRGAFSLSGRPSSFVAHSQPARQWGYRFLLPIAVGVTDFDGLDDLPDLDLDNLQTLSFVPGIEFEYPVNEQWLIRPFVQAGFGYEFDDGDSTLVWGAGVRTRAWLDAEQRWLTGGEFLWAGNNPNSSELESNSFTRISVALDYRIPTQQRLFERGISWHVRGIYRKFGNDLDFEAPPNLSDIDHSRELAVTLELSSPIRLLGFEIVEAGLGYEQADEFKAIKLVGGFPF